jgi:hypothetical protein
MELRFPDCGKHEGLIGIPKQKSPCPPWFPLVNPREKFSGPLTTA